MIDDWDDGIDWDEGEDDDLDRSETVSCPATILALAGLV